MQTFDVLKRCSLLRRDAILALTGYSRSRLYSKMAEGLMVRPIKIGARAVAWPFEEVEAIVRARVQGKADNEIRTLVRHLEGARKSGC